MYGQVGDILRDRLQYNVFTAACSLGWLFRDEKMKDFRERERNSQRRQA